MGNNFSKSSKYVHLKCWSINWFLPSMNEFLCLNGTKLHAYVKLSLLLIYPQKKRLRPGGQVCFQIDSVVTESWLISWGWGVSRTFYATLIRYFWEFPALGSDCILFLLWEICSSPKRFWTCHWISLSHTFFPQEIKPLEVLRKSIKGRTKRKGK